MIDYAHTTRELLKLAGVRRFIPIEDKHHSHSLTRGEDTVLARIPTDEETLAIVAHEAGHVATSDLLNDRGYSLLSIEYCATRWGITALKKLGVEITPDMLAEWRWALGTYAADFMAFMGVGRDGTLRRITNFISGKSDD